MFTCTATDTKWNIGLCMPYTGTPTNIKYNTGFCATITVKAQTFFICLIP